MSKRTSSFAFSLLVSFTFSANHQQFLGFSNKEIQRLSDKKNRRKKRRKCRKKSLGVVQRGLIRSEMLLIIVAFLSLCTHHWICIKTLRRKCAHRANSSHSIRTIVVSKDRARMTKCDTITNECCCLSSAC